MWGNFGQLELWKAKITLPFTCINSKFLSANFLTILLRHIQSTWRRRQ